MRLGLATIFALAILAVALAYHDDDPAEAVLPPPQVNPSQQPAGREVSLELESRQASQDVDTWSNPRTENVDAGHGTSTTDWKGPSPVQKSNYRFLRLACRAAGKEVPRSIVGTEQLWAELDDAYAVYAMHIKKATTDRDKRVHAIALATPVELTERVGDAGKLQKISRADLTEIANHPKVVYVTRSTGTYRSTVQLESDPEADRLNGELNKIRTECAEVVTHICRSYGLLK